MTNLITVKFSHVLAVGKLVLLRREFVRQLKTAGVELAASECAMTDAATQKPMTFSRDGTFLRSPESHSAQAALLRKAGNYRLARHGENIAKIIERRQQLNEPERAAAVRRIMDEALAKAKG
jgi:hypothetical protein